MSRLRTKAAVGVIAVGLVAPAEGLRQSAYPDPATGREPWTVCFGETSGVKPGDWHSVAECKAMLLARLDHFGDQVEACIRRPMPDRVEVAFVSLAYNIGAGAFCKSTAARLWNAGAAAPACDAMRKFNRAAGIVFPGLTRRREDERRVCLAGVAEGVSP